MTSDMGTSPEGEDKSKRKLSLPDIDARRTLDNLGNLVRKVKLDELGINITAYANASIAADDFWHPGIVINALVTYGTELFSDAYLGKTGQKVANFVQGGLAIGHTIAFVWKFPLSGAIIRGAVSLINPALVPSLEASLDGAYETIYGSQDPTVSLADAAACVYMLKKD